MVEALKDSKVIVLMVFIFSGFFVTFYGMNDVGAKIIGNQTEIYKSLQNEKSVEKEIVKEIVHDTVYINSNGINFNSSNATVMEDNKRKPFMITFDFLDFKSAYEIEGITSYKILCDGTLFDNLIEGGISVKDCNGNWIFIVKGNRTFTGDQK